MSCDARWHHTSDEEYSVYNPCNCVWFGYKYIAYTYYNIVEVIVVERIDAIIIFFNDSVTAQLPCAHARYLSNRFTLAFRRIMSRFNRHCRMCVALTANLL